MNEYQRDELLALGHRHFRRGEIPEAVLCLVALLANDLHAADIAITHRGQVTITHKVRREGEPAPLEPGRAWRPGRPPVHKSDCAIPQDDTDETEGG